MIRNVLAFLVLIVPVTAFGDTFHERSDWGHFFSDEGVEGAIVVIDERENAFWEYGESRAKTRYLLVSIRRCRGYVKKYKDQFQLGRAEPAC